MGAAAWGGNRRHRQEKETETGRMTPPGGASPTGKETEKKPFSGKRLHIFYFSMTNAHMQGGKRKSCSQKMAKKDRIPRATLHILNVDSGNASYPSFLRRWAEGQACGPLPGCGTQAVSRRRAPAEGAPPFAYKPGMAETKPTFLRYAERENCLEGCGIAIQRPQLWQSAPCISAPDLVN